LKKAVCLIIVIMMLFSFAMIAPITASSEMALPDHASPLKYDANNVQSGAGHSKVMKKPVKPTPPMPDPTIGKWALIIGIADYKGGANDLWHPDEDAAEMYSELVDQQGYPAGNVKMLTNRAATASAILAAIDWLMANEKAGDEVVFFYSGHGFRAEDSVGWDGDSESDGYDEGIVSYDLYGLPDGMLKEKFAAIESTKFALLFGSCHSGGMFDDNDDLQQTGRIIASACKADQFGWDYSALGNTLWGYYFVDQGLLNNNAASIESAHEYAYPLVVAIQPDSQPQLYDGYDGEFVL